MSIQPVFERKFLDTTEEAYRGGVKAAPFAGLGFATGFALIYCAEGEYELFSEFCESPKLTRMILSIRSDAIRWSSPHHKGSLRLPEDASSIHFDRVRRHFRWSAHGLS